MQSTTLRAGLTVALLITSGALATPPVRVACIGDSITFGARVAAREQNAYPSQLQHRLGSGYDVRNFGVGGRTLLTAGDTPYVRSDAWQGVLAWSPDVAIVMLGTNDTCQNERRQNWEHERQLETDAQAMIETLQASNAAIRVLLSGPPPMFPHQRGLDDARRANLVAREPRIARACEAMRTVADRLNNVDYYDISRTLTVQHVVDGVHTNPFGAETLAERMADVIRTPAAPALDLRDKLAEREIQATLGTFHGFDRIDFGLRPDQSRCTIVAPHTPRSEYPWIWRARFFGHQPALDLELLDRGFHLAYCDVANLYGAPVAVQRWKRFHGLMQELGLGPRPVLEGMSRGGLPVLAYAAVHPHAVAAMYVDNPVVDPRSWPGGRTGKRSDADWERYLDVYSISEQDAWERNVVWDALAPAAAGRIPLLVVYGTADTVVPPAENAEPLAAHYAALGGPVERWPKPGLEHHPHGLHPPAALRRAILAACNIDSNPAVRATPSAEYRGNSAGWGGGTWWDQLETLQNLGRRQSDVPVVFLGDSITQSLSSAGDRVAREGGRRTFDRYHGRRGAISLGLSGDRTEHLLYRIDHGALATSDPRLIVLQIGVNNVNAAGHTAPETAAGILAVIERLREREPQASILVCGPFPLGSPGESRRATVNQVHTLIARTDAIPGVEYLDLRPIFLQENGETNDRMANDRVHLTSAGYEAWMVAIEPHIARLLSD